MKVTVITSCYNRQKTIAQAIESVIAQDYPEIEYIIVDGASKDGTVDVLNKYKTRFESDDFKKAHPLFSFKMISEPDHGMYEAINKGLRLATGDVIGLMHSDDFYYDNHTLSDLVKEFERTGADFVYGDGLYVNFENTDKVIRNWIGGTYSKRKVKAGWLPLHPTCYIKRTAYQAVGFYNEKYKIAADTDFLVRALYEHDLKISYLPRYIVKMRMGGLSTDNGKRKKMWDEDIDIYRSHGFHPHLTKIEKMMWKVPQFISAKLGFSHPH